MRTATKALVLCAAVLCLQLTRATAARSLFQAPATIAEAVAATPDLSVLGQALSAYPEAFNATLNDPNAALTIFAPTNTAILAALSSLGLTTLEGALTALPVKDILLYHVVSGAAKAADLVHGQSLFPLGPAGLRLKVDLKAGDKPIIRAFFSAAQVVQADVMAAKTVIHVIDTLLLPVATSKPAYDSVAAAATATPALSSLLAAVEKAGLTSALADPELKATIFAPTNEAFAAALQSLGLTLETIPVDVLTKVLTYHVAPGFGPTARMVADGTVKTLLDKQTLQFVFPTPAANASVAPQIKAAGSTATIVGADVFAGQSVVHVVDTVLLPTL